MHLEPTDVAVVTGAASGIGFALAGRLLERGLRVVLADVETDALGAAVERLDVGDRVLAVPTDVSDEGSVQDLAAATLDAFGGVHLVCNNAGVGGAGGFLWTLDERDWRWVVGVNVMGVVHGIRWFVPHLVEQGRGHVLNTASLAGLSTSPFMGPYNATKHAVVSITETLAADLALAGSPVGASVACPGFVDTAIFEGERNRPAELAHTGVESVDRPDLGAILRSMATDMQDPRRTAELMLDGVEAGDRYILTHPEACGPARERLDGIAAALPET